MGSHQTGSLLYDLLADSRAGFGKVFPFLKGSGISTKKNYGKRALVCIMPFISGRYTSFFIEF